MGNLSKMHLQSLLQLVQGYSIIFHVKYNHIYNQKKKEKRKVSIIKRQAQTKKNYSLNH